MRIVCRRHRSLGHFSRTIRGHLLLHHGMTTNLCHRGLTSSGVAIILGPALLRAWNMARKPPPVTSAICSEFPGQMIGITLCFPNRLNNKSDRYHNRGRGKIKIFLASIYHPVEHDYQKRFNEELASFYNAIPRNSELIAGQDVNSNIGVRSKMFRDVIKPNRIDNHNAKVKDLLFLLNSITFRVLLNYLRRNNYTTWRSFNSTRYPHIIDNFICYRPFFRRVKDCEVFNIGMCSDHTAILNSFKITAIKSKVTEKVVAQIDWKLIGYHNLTNDLFNNILSKYIAGGTTYSNYNKHIL